MSTEPVDHKPSLQEPLEGDNAQEKDIDQGIAIENVVLDPKKERKLLLKLDLAFVPIIMLTYLSCFLDRTNIGIFPLTLLSDLH
jgi:hypothetical protein